MVSIHAPWEGCDWARFSVPKSSEGFNSRTLGRVRQTSNESRPYQYHVSIHAPWEGCDVPLLSLELAVSIHAPWEGCDETLPLTASRPASFNSRTLGRVRRLSLFYEWLNDGFNSRTLGRVRRDILRLLESVGRFNSRTLGRVRLFTLNPIIGQLRVSIHAPWEGCDETITHIIRDVKRFNSRTLGRVRPHACWTC